MKVIYNGSREEYKGKVCDVIGGVEGIGDGYIYVQLDEFTKGFVDNEQLVLSNEEEETIIDPQDPINPSHYKQGIEVYDFIESHDMNFAQGNAIKYISRYKFKNGVEDLNKARWYLDKLIEETENRK